MWYPLAATVTRAEGVVNSFNRCAGPLAATPMATDLPTRIMPTAPEAAISARRTSTHSATPLTDGATVFPCDSERESRAESTTAPAFGAP